MICVAGTRPSTIFYCHCEHTQQATLSSANVSQSWEVTLCQANGNPDSADSVLGGVDINRQVGQSCNDSEMKKNKSNSKSRTKGLEVIRFWRGEATFFGLEERSKRTEAIHVRFSFASSMKARETI